MDDPGAGQAPVRGRGGQLHPHSPAKVDTGNEIRGPLLLITGGKDHTVPEVGHQATLKQYRHSDAVTDLMEFDRATP